MPPRNFIARAPSFIPSAMVAIALLVAAHRVHAQTLAADTSHATEVRDAAQTVRANSSDNLPEGLEKSDWSSIRAAYEAGRHKAFAVDGGYQARNPGQRWVTRFDGRGFSVQPDGGGWTWGLQLERYGFAGSERDVCETAKVSAKGQRVAYDWDATLQEWWLNDTRGLEHGYTLRERPASGAAGPLTITLALRGDLDAQVQEGGRGIRFTDTHGAEVLTYAGLIVSDADGEVLPARFEHLGEGLRLCVDEQGARYPLTIDPLAQQAYLKASNKSADPSDQFGVSVSVSGDTVIVGAYQESSYAVGVNGNQGNNIAPQSGAAYVFVRSGTTWSQQAYLKASNTNGSDLFGYSVSVSGDTVVVGAYGEDSSATGVNGNQSDNSATVAGAAYVFVRNGTTWSQQAYLKASNAGAFDWFGYSVSVSGDTVVVGAAHERSNAVGVNGDQNDNSAVDAGAAYVFVRSGTTWSQQAYLKASNTGAGDSLGSSVSVSGDTVVVGAPLEDSNAIGVNGNEVDNNMVQAGAAYVFVRSGTTWSQLAYLKASNTGTQTYFGISVSVSGDTAAVGAYGEDSNATGVDGNQGDTSANVAGAAYVFVRNGASWSQQAYLKASNTDAGDQFGYSVSVSGDTLVVGARDEDSNATGLNGNQGDNSAFTSGAAYVFVRSGATWSQQAYLKASNTDANDGFGISVSVSDNTVLVGGYREDSNALGPNGNEGDNSAANAGATYVFVRSATTWGQQAYLKASTSHAGDSLGVSVSVSGNTAVVGAHLEDSGATGVNGNQGDNSVDGAGAAYVFVRSGATWSQQAYLKASNTGAGDHFGVSVSVSGDTIVVGADGEASSFGGVNANQSDNSAPGAGAVYVFVRNGTTWSQQAYLKASNPGGTDYFGYTLSVSGDTVVVGAYNEDSSATGVNGNESDNSASGSGAAYVFVRSGTTWSQQAYLQASNSGANDFFGVSVSVSGDTVVAGAWKEGSNATGVNGNQADNSFLDAGAAYVFVRSGTTWSQQAYLKASNTAASDVFGISVSVSADTAVVGAYGEASSAVGVNGNQADNSAQNAGAAYVFTRFGTSWSQEAYLKASNAGINDDFGVSVSVSGNTVVVGALYEDSNSTGVNGNQANNGALDAGAAYVFTRVGTTWSQQSYLKASNSGTSDYFGISASVSGDTVVVGALGEDSNATGVNGDPTDNSAVDSGAAYIFTVDIGASGPGAFCAGDGMLIDHATQCPCGNNGVPGNGCGHSFDPNGANLSATGLAANDDVVLHSSFEPVNSFTLFMQHDAAGDRSFHDGVLCANGALIRLRGRSAVAGEAFFPNSLFANDSTLTLSSRGGVFPGQGVRRYYAAWYRNASMTFCPPATANVTNGWIVDW